MLARVWSQSKDNRFRWQTLSSKYLPGALLVLRESLFVNESGCKVVKMSENHKASKQCEDLCSEVAQDGVSVVAIEVATDKVVGVAINKILVKQDLEECLVMKKFRQNPNIDPAFAEFLNFLIKMEGLVDIFEHYRVSSALDLMFLATQPDFYRQGIGRGLVAATTDMAKAMFRGEDVAVPISQDLWKEDTLRTVGAVLAQFTSPISQKIGRSLGWEELASCSYDQLFYKGQSYSFILGKENPKSAFMAKKL